MAQIETTVPLDTIARLHEKDGVTIDEINHYACAGSSLKGDSREASISTSKTRPQQCNKKARTVCVGDSEM
jgi:hypothetical protein